MWSSVKSGLCRNCVESEWRGIHVYKVRCGRLVWTLDGGKERGSRYSKNKDAAGNSSYMTNFANLVNFSTFLPLLWHSIQFNSICSKNLTSMY